MVDESPHAWGTDEEVRRAEETARRSFVRPYTGPASAEVQVDPTMFVEMRHAIGLHLQDQTTVKAYEDENDRNLIRIGDLAIRKAYEPHNPECEAALLGALMIDNRLVDHVTGLQPGHFAVSVHADIFTAIRDRVGRNEIANPVTLRPLFQDHEELQDAGGAAYLAQLTGSGAAVIGARDFAQQITDLFVLRMLRERFREAMKRSTGAEDVSPAEIVGDLETQLTETLIEPPVKHTATFAESFRDVTLEYEAIEGGAAPPGLTINRFNDWNAVVGRMETGDLILLGARPSMGKTGVAATVALGAAEAGVPTDLLSLEMDRRKATRRIIAAQLYDVADPIPYEDLVAGRLNMARWRMIRAAQAEIETLPLTISDPPTMAVEDVGPHIRKRKREFEKRFGKPLQLVVLDYLGRLGTRKRLNGTTEIVTHISQTLKAAAKENDVVLIALAQLSRALEGRENKRPMLADLRDSGSLEQDADIVIFLYREEYYLERAEPRREQGAKWAAWAEELAAVRDDMEIYSAKKREGALSKRISKFLTKHQAVLDHDDPRVTGFAPGLFDDEWPEMRG